MSKSAVATATVAPPEAEVAAPPTGAFVVATHEALFQAAGPACCDACGERLLLDDDDDAYGPRGEGVYLWTRGGERRFDKVPLCSWCASAISMAALARWEIEEEEG